MEMESLARVVLVTAPSAESAESLVRRLVEERVVACGTVLPAVTSIYRWEGAVARESEALIIFKTTVAGAERLTARVPELHPYDVPEVLILPVEDGHAPYLEWVRENVIARD